MKIYAVKENYVASDSDDYMHWNEYNILSYHSTEELANAEISNLIKITLDEFPEHMKIYIQHVEGDEFWNKQKEEIITNLIPDANSRWYNRYNKDDEFDVMNRYDFICIELKN